MQGDQVAMWRRARSTMLVVSGCCAFAALIWPSWGTVLLLIAAGAAVVCVQDRLYRTRVDRAYALMAKIGEGEFAASDDPVQDEPSVRLHRGIARVQRGFSEALAHAESERDEVRSLLAAVDTGLITLDQHLRIRSANGVAERLLGFSSGNYRGNFLAQVIREPELLKFLETALGSSGPVSKEITISGGTADSVFAAAEPIRGSHGQLTGILVAIDDMTRLRRLEQLRTDFAANVSHELRTPITNIKGYLDTLVDIGYDDPKQVERFLGIVQRNANRLCTLVEDILLLAFLERPGVERQVSFAQTKVLDIVRDAVEQLEAAAAAKSMPIVVDVSPDLSCAMDSTLATQAILNLVSNAIKYAPADTTISISAELDDRRVRVRVADQGPGIDPIHLPRLFERFYRVESARSRELGGTGLGLAIVKHIAMVHGGKVAVDCPPSGGTLFSIWFSGGSLLPNHS